MSSRLAVVPRLVQRRFSLLFLDSGKTWTALRGGAWRKERTSRLHVNWIGENAEGDGSLGAVPPRWHHLAPHFWGSNALAIDAIPCAVSALA